MNNNTESFKETVISRLYGAYQNGLTDVAAAANGVVPPEHPKARDTILDFMAQDILAAYERELNQRAIKELHQIIYDYEINKGYDFMNGITRRITQLTKENKVMTGTDFPQGA